MLEQSSLLLGAWVPPSAGSQEASPTRAVLEPVSRVRLGFVRRRHPPWSRWLGRQALDIYEAQDESLLSTVLAPWWLQRAWEVYDAEERRVAIVRGPEVLDGFGRPLALLHQEEKGRVTKFLTTEGVELGEWIVTGEEALLQFAPAVVSQPFAKMALLGVLLSHD